VADHVAAGGQGLADELGGVLQAEVHQVAGASLHLVKRCARGRARPNGRGTLDFGLAGAGRLQCGGGLGCHLVADGAPADALLHTYEILWLGQAPSRDEMLGGDIRLTLDRALTSLQGKPGRPIARPRF
jgi:hypothetical protein